MVLGTSFIVCSVTCINDVVLFRMVKILRVRSEEEEITERSEICNVDNQYISKLCLSTAI